MSSDRSLRGFSERKPDEQVEEVPAVCIQGGRSEYLMRRVEKPGEFQPLDGK
ncbi:hypothetical protein ACKFKG_07250 [Phormidesmis sp. 146-35]